MINSIGKVLALLQAGLCVLLMFLALALYLNAVDFGWEQPARYWREVKGKKGENLLVPSLLDKREAAMRELMRVKRDELLRLGATQEQAAGIAQVLAKNHLEANDILDQLEKGDSPDIRYIKVEDAAAHGSGGRPSLALPVRETAVPGINSSFEGYAAKWKNVQLRIKENQVKTGELLEKEAALTSRLSGKIDQDGKQVVDNSGSVVEPGLYYLVEKESEAQRQLLKELEYVQPLWVKELVDSQTVLARRDSLLRRLQELGDKGYMPQSEFLRKLP